MPGPPRLGEGGPRSDGARVGLLAETLAGEGVGGERGAFGRAGEGLESPLKPGGRGAGSDNGCAGASSALPHRLVSTISSSYHPLPCPVGPSHLASRVRGVY